MSVVDVFASVFESLVLCSVGFNTKKQDPKKTWNKLDSNNISMNKSY